MLALAHPPFFACRLISNLDFPVFHSGAWQTGCLRGLQEVHALQPRVCPIFHVMGLLCSKIDGRKTEGTLSS